MATLPSGLETLYSNDPQAWTLPLVVGLSPLPPWVVGCQGRGSLVGAVYGVAQSRTRLKRHSSSSSSSSRLVNCKTIILRSKRLVQVACLFFTGVWGLR